MRMRELLREDHLGRGLLCAYDKSPGSAYLLYNDKPIECRDPHRMNVPLTIESGDVDVRVFELVRYAAELGWFIDYEGSFTEIRAYFASKRIPLRTVIKNARLEVEVPADVAVIDWPAMRMDRMYCLTEPTQLGVMPVQAEHRGYAIWNPSGILTAFFESTEI